MESMIIASPQLWAEYPPEERGWWIVNQRNAAVLTTATIVVWAHDREAARNMAALLGVPVATNITGPYPNRAVPEGCRSRVLSMDEINFVLWEG